METISETKQPLLKRTVSVFKAVFEGATPKRSGLAEQISKKTKATVVVTHVYTISGQQAAYVHCHIYSDPAVSAAVERANLLAKPAAKTEQPAAQPSAAKEAS